MPGEHARLSPSAAERWLVCPASIRLAAEVPPEPDSPYAAEGTCAHELGEIKLRYALGQISRNQMTSRVAHWRKQWGVSDATEFEMDSYTDQYVALVEARASLYPGTQVMVEQRLDTGVPTCWGTSDAVLASPQHVEIVDLKYGRGVQVEAKGNPQLRLYALGALDTYGDLLGHTELVRTTVFQPRLDHIDVEELHPKELRDWRTSILPAAALALSDDAPFNPSEVACRWCPASGHCRAQLQSIFEDEATDFTSDPDTLSEAELADVFERIPKIRAWLDAVEIAALDRAHNQRKPLPGFKVVLSGGKRSLKDSALQALLDLGYDAEEVSTRKVNGIGALETLMGKQVFAQKLKDHINPAVGRPSLVSDKDPRPSLDPAAQAAKDFGEDLL